MSSDDTSPHMAVTFDNIFFLKPLPEINDYIKITFRAKDGKTREPIFGKIINK
jgi:hypothetical protein